MHQRFELPSNNKANILYISKTKIEKGFLPSIHSHPNLEIIWIVDNFGFIEINNESIKVEKGDLITVNKNQQHFESNNSLEFYALGLNKLEIENEIKIDENMNIIKLNNEKYEIIKNLYDGIFFEAKKVRNLAIDNIESYVKILLNMLLRFKDIRFHEIENNTNNPTVELCKKIIDANFCSDIDLELLSKRLNISKYHLCHLFKKETGISIIEYKINKQIEEAKNLLLNTDMRVNDISLLVGFTNSSYFSKYFKKITNLTPLEFKKQIKS